MTMTNAPGGGNRTGSGFGVWGGVRQTDLQDSGTITRQLRLLSRCVAACTCDPELALANKLQWTPKINS